MSRVKLFSPRWDASVIPKDATIRQALAAINNSGSLMACIVNESFVLQAILTDSDIRQALLQGAGLDDGAWPWANQSPVVAQSDRSSQDLTLLGEKNAVREIPLVDDNRRLVDIFVLTVHKERYEAPISPLSQITASAPVLPNSVLIQAGGLGTRLRSVIVDRPKPLALVGDRPILETLIAQVAANGFRKIYVSVNYMAELIEQHLMSPKYKELDIVILREYERLGTAGSIGLIADEIVEPLLVVNADVLTTAPFRLILKHHDSVQADLTVSVRPYTVTIPFGVVNLHEGQIHSIKEKPESSFLVNAGIYIMNRLVCQRIQKNIYTDMPALIEEVLALPEMKAIPFLLHEYWIDIGQPDDFHRANKEYNTVFGQQ